MIVSLIGVYLGTKIAITSIVTTIPSKKWQWENHIVGQLIYQNNDGNKKIKKQQLQMDIISGILFLIIYFIAINVAIIFSDTFFIFDLLFLDVFNIILSIDSIFLIQYGIIIVTGFIIGFIISMVHITSLNQMIEMYF